VAAALVAPRASSNVNPHCNNGTTRSKLPSSTSDGAMRIGFVAVFVVVDDDDDVVDDVAVEDTAANA
jgi:hypothetical protein